jgi:site-specific DNA-methyltransferase (adenine-specific)
MRLELGDCLEVLKNIPDNSVDSIVTDPPYGLSFMNKKWDYDVPSTEIWMECLRVLKPGGHLLSFSGSRTYHRMAVRIEDAGFEIRDQIMWVYGSGFPKSHNIGKAVDKLQGNEREVVGMKRSGIVEGPFGSPDESKKHIEDTRGNSEWEGWGTALKPAHEPIVMARKPLSEKTVAENVLRWGTGGLNIDDSRIGTEQIKSVYGGFTLAKEDGRDIKKNNDWIDNSKVDNKFRTETTEGRWPANIIFDEEAGQVLDQQSGELSKQSKSLGNNSGWQDEYVGGKINKPTPRKLYGDKGGASRFFYCPKASKKDRDEGLDGFEDKLSEISQVNSDKVLQPNGEYVEHNPLPRKNNHPTVKPTALMEYLIKLVTPVNGTVMDCFLGSGSTGKAAIRGGFDFIGIEREEEYIKIAEARIKNEMNG